MRLVVDNPYDGAEDVELIISDPDATVAELLHALGEDQRAPGVVLDGRFCHSDLALEEIGLYEGVTLRTDGPPRDVHNPAPAALELRVVGGLDAARRIPLRDGVTVNVGRDPRNDLVLNDAGVSRAHVQFTAGPTGSVAVSDLGSANGTWIEGHLLREPGEVNPGSIIEAGDVALVVASPDPALPFDPLRQVRSDGTAAFNRPPRTQNDRDVKEIALPEAPPKPTKPTFSTVSAVGPLVMGGAMVLVMHNLMFAAFCILSPVLTMGNYAEQRRRAKKGASGQGKEHKVQIAKFKDDLAERREHTLERMRLKLPDIGEVVRRATAPEPSLWERRPTDPDWLRVTAGFAKVPFNPLFSEKDRRNVAPEAEAALHRLSRLPPAPVEVDLHLGGAVGIVGPREESLAVARALLCQVATLHGPADLQVVLMGDRHTIDSWDFAKWLPHARDNFAGGSRRQITNDRTSAEELIGALRERQETDGRVILAVLDSPELIEGRGAPGRMLLREGSRVSGIILATTTERLPVNCNTVIELTPGTAEARLTRPQMGQEVDPMLVSGISVETAVECARGLARFEDADMQLEGGTLPTGVELLPLLGLGNCNPSELVRRWKDNDSEGGLRATLAVDRDGPFAIDLVKDGPHGLIAGTTGSGKSEMLRSLVAALAARYSPERLNFVLIDYKGGSAFARCADLPHTVGMVTDLDEQLGARALTSMEAELRYRERKLREYGADDLPGLNKLVAAGQAEPMPRLVVIIDEFATLASELPDFVSSLVGIAQRGRSLGVHMLLATQRPSGAVNENIRANTNIRICLRVQTPQDSNDVLDDRVAATISRIQPGRAYVRLGPGELDPVQTALVTGPAVSAELASVRVRPFDLVPEPAPEEGNSEAEKGLQETSLDLLVSAAVEAHGDRPPPRRPWLEPLDTEIQLETLLEASDQPNAYVMPFAGDRGLLVPIALADDPARQTQYPAGWNLDAGNLLIYGIGGSGTTTALQTLAISLALRADPNQLHMYIMDFGAGEQMPLAELPHVGAVLGSSEGERQTRLIRMLRREMVARREHGYEGKPRIVVLIDSYSGFVNEHSDMAGDAVRDAFARVFADGPEVGIHVAIVADRPGAVPGALVSLSQQRVVMQLADAGDYAGFGIRKQYVPSFNPGKAVLPGTTPMIMQMAKMRTPIAQIAQVLNAEGAPANAPAGVGVLPSSLSVAALLDQVRSQPSTTGPDAFWLPVGIEDGDLVAAGWTLYPGEHAMVSGPARTGRSSILIAIAQICAALHPEIEIAAAGTPRSSLLAAPGLWARAVGPDQLAELLQKLNDPADSHRHRLLLIDDADAIDDTTRGLATLLGNRNMNLNVIAAGRAETFRALGNWTMGLRSARNGLLLSPDLNLDGGPMGITLPRRPAPPTRPGCGYLVAGGAFGLCQAAAPGND